MVDFVMATRTNRDGFLISTDRSMLDVDAIHAFLSTCYWSPGIHRSKVELAIERSLCFGVYDAKKPRGASAESANGGGRLQVGFARVVTDCASFAYLCDVFIIEECRGRGLSKWLMETILAHPDLQGLRRFCLMTRDAHGLYGQFGFTPMPDPTKYLERVDRQGYKEPARSIVEI